MYWVWMILGVVIGLVCLVFIVGALRAKAHTVSQGATFRVSPQTLWGTITDFAHWPEWNAYIQKMERIADKNGHTVWMSQGKWGNMPMEIEVFEPTRRLVTRVADPGGNFGGTWTYEIEPTQEGSQLTITERGEVNSAFFRGMMIFHDNEATLRSFLTALRKRVESQNVAVASNNN